MTRPRAIAYASANAESSSDRTSLPHTISSTEVEAFAQSKLAAWAVVVKAIIAKTAMMYEVILRLKRNTGVDSILDHLIGPACLAMRSGQRDASL